jgi:hypothetical protein
VARSDLVDLPVHPGGALVVNLHAVDADISRARLRIAGVHICQRDKTSAILWPTFENRKIAQRETDRSGIQYLNHFLASRFLDLLGTRMEEMDSLLEQTPTLPQIGWRFRFEDELNFLGDISDVPDLQGKLHPPSRSHRIDCNGEFRFFSIDNRLLEKKRFATARRLHLAVRPFCNEQICVDRNNDALQLAGLLKGVEELSK